MVECPMFDTTCPYCDPNGYCRMLEEEGCEPYEECEAFYEYESEEENE